MQRPIIRIQETQEKLLTGLFFILFLVPVWLPAFFLTGDGPCHLYNSRILLDYWSGNNVEFYGGFYDRNPGLDPNLFSHYFLASLMNFFPAAISEKIFVTTYLSLWFSGWYLLSRKAGKNNLLLLLIIIPLAFNTTLLMGFYNFSFSLALLPWAILPAFYFSDKFSAGYFIANMVLFTCMFFTHIMGLLCGLGCLGGIIFLDGIRNKLNFFQFIKSISNHILLPAALPLILMSMFAVKKGIHPSIKAEPIGEKVLHLFSMDFMVSLSWHEEKLALAFSIFLFLLIGYAIYGRIKNKDKHLLDGVLLFLPIVIIFYLWQPITLGAGGILEIRLRLIIWLLILVWLFSVSFKNTFNIISLVFVSGLVSGFLLLRIPRHIRAGESVRQVFQITKSIEPESIVLPLHFDFNGLDETGMIGERVWMYMHFADYIGTEIPLILLGNYEAHQDYFPFHWKAGQDPFIQLGPGIEGQPPCVDIEKYELSTGHKIDYVFTSNALQTFPNHPCYKELKEKLDEDFNQVSESADERMVLYKRKL